MKVMNKEDLISIIDKSTQELHDKIDMHRYLMAAILSQRVNEQRLNKLSFFSPGEAKLREALKEAIEVLEQSRKAFKSKQLEALRKRLTAVLVDTG